MKNMFVARKWTDSESQEFKYDVVYLDFENNNQHYDPELKLSTWELASAYAMLYNNIAKETNDYTSRQANWPIDGVIPDHYTGKNNSSNRK